MNIAILASGSGTNAENIIRYFQEKRSGSQVSLVITNRRQAMVRERAAGLSVPCLYFPKEEWSGGEAVLTTLRAHHIDWVILAGFLLRVPESILNAYPDQVINIHPALLPNYGGKGMYGDRVHAAVIAAHEKVSGITIHYVNAQYDEGAIIFQATCPVLPEDTPHTLAQRIHILEYTYFPQTIEKAIASLRNG
ncbi:MAG: phosphoribosylglycinamide formyltransferase [Prevotellaceae bacterium]|jgi:phosphoribosylglycinamide formyltransferase-1|nr:phosphoribosylglycinamide formyltransferase [Prevotellaceae bacterium]